jgi:uncharacterized phage-associated protein
MPHDARDIANFLLDYAEDKGTSLTIMALLKLIYFAHGWHLARYEQPLVKNAFEAWQYGPVVRAVYESFSESGKKPITIRACKFDPVKAKYSRATYNLTAEERALLQNVFEAYAYFHAFKLSDMTHEENSPWHMIWNNVDSSSRPGMQISNSSIKEHFQRHASVAH